MKYNFIKTKDKETRNKLINLGFILVDDNNGIATFLNESDKMNFSDDKNVVYSNALTF